MGELVLVMQKEIFWCYNCLMHGNLPFGEFFLFFFVKNDALVMQPAINCNIIIHEMSEPMIIALLSFWQSEFGQS